MRAALETAAGNPENQDRGAVSESTIGLVLVAADGAGGLSGGTAAAIMAVESVRQNANELRNANVCASLLQNLDQAVYKDRLAGETTCALAVVTQAAIYGASVGDSGVWLIDENGFVNLTERQSRKPLVGSGSALPVPFEYGRACKQSQLLATDGLLKYTGAERIVAVCRDTTPSDVPRRLIELVRYPSGALPDDVTVIFAHEWK